MGKIFAIGGGGSEDFDLFPIFQKIVKDTGKKNPNMVFLPTGHFDSFDAGWALDFAEFLRLGCTLRLLFVTDPSVTRDEVKTTLENADIIYACGGNLKFIMESWNRTGATDAIRTAYHRGAVLAGPSSGSMCWFETGWDDCGENSSFEFIHGVGLLPYCNCPHFNSAYWQAFRETVKTQPLSGIAAENSAALFFDGEKCSCVQGADLGRVYYLDAKNGFAETDLTEKCWALGNEPV